MAPDDTSTSIPVIDYAGLIIDYYVLSPLLGLPNIRPEILLIVVLIVLAYIYD